MILENYHPLNSFSEFDYFNFSIKLRRKNTDFPNAYLHTCALPLPLPTSPTRAEHLLKLVNLTHHNCPSFMIHDLLFTLFFFFRFLNVELFFF